MRLNGTARSSSSLTLDVIPVRVTPGANAFTRIPAVLSSSAAVRVRPFTACLAATQGPLFGIAVAPSIDEVLTMAPDLWRRIWAISARMQCHTPMRSTCSTRRNSSAGQVGSGDAGIIVRRVEPAELRDYSINRGGDRL
jgi:hypothetical protein